MTITKKERNVFIVAVVLLVYMLIVQIKEVYPLLEMIGEYLEIRDITTSLIMMTVTYLGILFLLISKKRGLPTILVVCAVVVGIDNMADAYLLLIEYRQYFSEELMIYLTGVISLVVATLLLTNSVFYARGLSKSTKLILYSTLALLVLNILFIIEEIHQGSSLFESMQYRRSDYPNYALLILMIYLLNSEEVKQNTTMYTITSSMRDLRNSMAALGMSVDRDILGKLVRINDGPWFDRYSFILSTFYSELYVMSVENKDGSLMVRIRSIENRSGMNSFKFKMKWVWTDTGDVSTCDLVRIYGENGMFIQLIASDGSRYKEKKVPRSKNIILFSFEPETWTHIFKVKVKKGCESVKGTILGPGYVRKEYK